MGTNVEAALDEPTLDIRLQELITALDRRVPRPERANELEIARVAALLRSEAVRRLAALQGRAKVDEV